ncbi:hypothetical protein POSPLADRAFT_1063910 [Postia placenta MAD-698-R-SB12]|uniref:Uncharacterized protein n=1 Tax=Postia placenta MAD-698-R-SB12 TaxID=670580 RepID=A0A1X6NFB8_9APHY|nr:hypothetical protein POSPLADRAFT_1063910 [Postia placenta MAD-698-R-SB12]OSX67063.1 hypothetical protein POSPLADRAFT_1063910 [Postia placenta MAD-698-R-SB12]
MSAKPLICSVLYSLIRPQASGFDGRAAETQQQKTCCHLRDIHGAHNAGTSAVDSSLADFPALGMIAPQSVVHHMENTAGYPVVGYYTSANVLQARANMLQPSLGACQYGAPGDWPAMGVGWDSASYISAYAPVSLANGVLSQTASARQFNHADPGNATSDDKQLGVYHRSGETISMPSESGFPNHMSEPFDTLVLLYPSSDDEAIDEPSSCPSPVPSLQYPDSEPGMDIDLPAPSHVPTQSHRLLSPLPPLGLSQPLSVPRRDTNPDPAVLHLLRDEHGMLLVREGVYNVEHNNAGIEVTAECQEHNNMNIATVGNRMPRGDSGDGNWSRMPSSLVGTSPVRLHGPSQRLRAMPRDAVRDENAFGDAGPLGKKLVMGDDGGDV